MEHPVGLNLAEFNISETKYDLDDPRMAGFINNLDRINAVAERMPGFVWRLKDEPEGTMASAWDGNTRLIDNLSVWETPEQLITFAFRTAHRKIFTDRAKWFQPPKNHQFVMWWVSPGHTPSREEAQARLRQINEHGPTVDAFGWDALEIDLSAVRVAHRDDTPAKEGES